MENRLIQKYDVPAPRYTSYPTVPFWSRNPTPAEWKESVLSAYNQVGNQNGIALYVHIPFCESLCTFCGCTTRTTKNHTVELPYVETVLKEWAMYRKLLDSKPSIVEIHLGGGSPDFLSPESMNQLISGLTKDVHIPKEHSFSVEVNPATVNAEKIIGLAAAGFTRISMGIQDFDPKVQQLINRVQTYAQVEAMSQKARAVGFTSVNYDLIYGLPGQTETGIRETISKVIQLNPDRIALYSYAHVPWLRPGQRSFDDSDLPTGAAKRKLYEISKSLFLENGFYEVGMDHFARKSDELFQFQERGKLHRNFMGYTTTQTKLMIGLGVSSISDSWGCFVQNEKKYENYVAQVNRGEWPFFRGHLLNDEDKIIRQHILNIMCKYETSWADEKVKFSGLSQTIERLLLLQEDELVLLEGDSLKVTEMGKPFLRNICVAFDLLLWKQTPETKIFSQSV